MDDAADQQTTRQSWHSHASDLTNDSDEYSFNDSDEKSDNDQV